VLPTELEHLLGFPDAANQVAAEISPAKDEAADLNGERFSGHAHLREGAVAFQEKEAGVDVVLGGDGVEDELPSDS